ncbi:MAG: hypothetical protein AB7S38_14765 [Vulcanimicrobiota bacterium]
MQDLTTPAESELAGATLQAGFDDEINEVVRALRRAVDAMVGLDCSFEERERAALSIGNEAQRRLLEDELQSIVEAHGVELLIDGELYRKHRPGARDYASLCGALRVSRCTYRLAGVRNGPTVVPLEMQAGLMEGATPAMAYRVALGYAKEHSRGLEEDLRASHRVPPSRTKLEKICPRGSDGERRRRRPASRPVFVQNERLPEDVAGISIGLDRTAVPMEEARAEGVAPKTQRKARTKPYLRTPPGPVDVNYRMAYVGTVSLTDEYGEGLATRRYAAIPSDGPDDMLHGMMGDVRNALRRNPQLRVGVVQDGAPEMWNLVRASLKTAEVTEWLETIDRYHLNERLARVLKVIEPNPDARIPQLRAWHDEFDIDDQTIERIEATIVSAIKTCRGDGLVVLEDNATFIGNNKDRMRYVALGEAGRPVSSGATKGACRYVIGERAKRASRRWHEDGLEAALALRSIYCSDRLPRFFVHLQRCYSAEIREADWSNEPAA